jgi:hypothetical protein
MRLGFELAARRRGRTGRLGARAGNEKREINQLMSSSQISFNTISIDF